jgi:hypothetical protein
MRPASQLSAPHKIQQCAEQFAPILTREWKLSHPYAASLEPLPKEYGLPRIDDHGRAESPRHHGDRILDLSQVHRQPARGSPCLQVLDYDDSRLVISSHRRQYAPIMRDSKVQANCHHARARWQVGCENTIDFAGREVRANTFDPFVFVQTYEDVRGQRSPLLFQPCRRNP